MNKAAMNEPDPKPGKTDIGDLVINDIKARIELSKVKYGTVLQSYNGRDALMDAYQEAIDLCMYLKQAMEERDSERS